MAYNYEIKVFPSKNNEGEIYWSAIFPEIKGIVGGGDSPEEAIKEAEENLSVYIQYLKEECEPIPQEYIEPKFSGKIALRTSKSTHLKLALKAEEEGISINALINNAIENYMGKKDIDSIIRERFDAILMCENKNFLLGNANLLYNQRFSEYFRLPKKIYVEEK